MLASGSRLRFIHLMLRFARPSVTEKAEGKSRGLTILE
jgi:hypothetical protein